MCHMLMNPRWYSIIKKIMYQLFFLVSSKCACSITKIPFENIYNFLLISDALVLFGFKTIIEFGTRQLSK